MGILRFNAMLACLQGVVQKKHLIDSLLEHFKGKSWKSKAIIFSLVFLNLIIKRYSTLFINYHSKFTPIKTGYSMKRANDRKISSHEILEKFLNVSLR